MNDASDAIQPQRNHYEDLPDSIYIGGFWEPNAFDVTADGQRFLMLELIQDASEQSKQAKPDVVLVENWFEEFRRK